MWVAPVLTRVLLAEARWRGYRDEGGRLTAGVVSGNDRLVLSDSVGIGLLDAAEESFVEIRLVVHATVAVYLSESTAIYTCRVCA